MRAENLPGIWDNGGASANYSIDSKGRIGGHVDEENRSWASSSSANDNLAVTIELANDGGAPDWHVSTATFDAAIKLVTDICQRNGIAELRYTNDTTGNLTRHNMFAATTCPGPYLQAQFPRFVTQVNGNLMMHPDRIVLRAGSYGGPVMTLQIELPNYTGKVDGDFGQKTETAVKEFQFSNDLIPDGVVGEKTWKALLSSPRPATPPEYDLAAKLKAAGYVGDDGYWRRVLNGETTAKPEFLKVLFENVLKLR